MSDDQILPTSTIEEFKQQLNNPNVHLSKTNVFNQKIAKLDKNLVLSFSQDVSGCGHIRNIWWLTYLNSIYGKTGNFLASIIPFYYYNHDIMMRVRTLFFPRIFNPQYSTAIEKYYQMKDRYKYKMIYDIDDYIWGSDKSGEEANPEYNKGSSSIGNEQVKAATEMMKKMDNIVVSTEFLKNYLQNELKLTNKITVLPNCIAAYMWNRPRRKPIDKKIEKPRVLYTGSPAHYSNEKKLYGDFEGAWQEWLIKSIKDNKIHFKVLGGLPWFLEPVKNKIEHQRWVNCYVYHMAVLDFNADFGISPLVPNYFNYCKSDIKHIEYCAAGCVSMGSIFTNGKPSPYDNNYIKIPIGSSSEFIQEQINMACEPEVFNNIIKKQYQDLDSKNRWLESRGYIDQLMKIF